MNNRILLIAGTRPNFIKLAPLYHTLTKKKYDIKICHTGQHYDKNMSGSFWETLRLPNPDFSLNVRGSNVPEIIGKTTVAIGNLLNNHRFDFVIVFGDVNATAAGSIAAVQTHIPVMHVEAGLRSYDRLMPEEINRMITDHITDYLMVSEKSGIENLKKEGICDDKVFFVGNIMIESLLMTKEKWGNIEHNDVISNFIRDKYAIATFHRHENVDTVEDLNKIIAILREVSKRIRIVLPLHPRTYKNLQKFNLLEEINSENILITQPLDYFRFINLVSNSKVVLTDSGGIQEETSYLNIPCVTFRKNTERPITIELGTNILMSVDEKNTLDKVLKHVLDINEKKYEVIPLWDNQVSERIEKVIFEK